MSESYVSILILLIIIGFTAFAISKSMKYKTEREKNAIRKGFLAYLLTDSLLIGWLIFKRHDKDDHL